MKQPAKYNKVSKPYHRKSKNTSPFEVQLRHGTKKVHTEYFQTEFEAAAWQRVRAQDIAKGGGVATWSEFDPERDGSDDIASGVLEECSRLVLAMASTAGRAADAAVLRAQTQALKAVKDASSLIIAASAARGSKEEDLTRLDWPELVARCRETIEDAVDYLKKFADKD